MKTVSNFENTSKRNKVDIFIWMIAGDGRCTQGTIQSETELCHGLCRSKNPRFIRVPCKGANGIYCSERVNADEVCRGKDIQDLCQFDIKYGQFDKSKHR